MKNNRVDPLTDQTVASSKRDVKLGGQETDTGNRHGERRVFAENSLTYWGLEGTFMSLELMESTMGKAHKAPGKHFRRGISHIELARMFPDEAASREWFERILWSEGRFCPRCGTDNNYACRHPKMPYRCRDCKRYFSVKTGTVMEQSNIPLQKWVWGIYLELTSLKSVSAMKLHRDLGITQKSAWFMLHRLREVFVEMGPQVLFDGPVEADETFFGGEARRMNSAQRKKLPPGRGSVGKVAVVGVKDRSTNAVAARVVAQTDGETLRGYVREHVEPGADLYTDGEPGYRGLREYEHGVVRHSAGEYVDGHVHTQGIESFWSMLKRAWKGTFHKFSPKHLQRYVDEFAGKHNIRDLDTMTQMAMVTEGMAGKRLTYKDLIKPNGLPSHARPPADEF